MHHFDHDYLEDVIKRLGRIKPDAPPAWGTLTPQAMIQHLADSVRYSMGKMGAVFDRSSWFTRNIVAPLILNKIVKIPRNIKAPEYPDAPARRVADNIESLHALLDTYLSLVQAGELRPKPHYLFGDLGIDGWSKFHIVHFEHHLRQFDA